ncbi:unnamed protein product [Dicrocoelium dendriticum]|nr:unnamed protein product [Dicrocoelium dendriticum]
MLGRFGVSRLCRLTLAVARSQPNRTSTWYSSKPRLFYRDQGKPDEKLEGMARYFMLAFWTWMFYHIINNGRAIIGENVFPDPSTFTDAELGIE